MIKSLFTDYKTKLFVISVYLIAVTLPWSVKLNGFFLIVSMLLAAFHVKNVEWRDLKTSDWLYILSFALFFFIHVISLTYTINLKQGLHILEKKWVFLLLPLCILIVTNLSMDTKKILRYFSYSVLAATVIALILAGINNYKYNEEHNLVWFSFNHWFYSYKLLSDNIEIHPSYLSCFVSLATFYLLTQVIAESGTKRIIIKSLVILYFLFYLILLSSRNVLVTTLILIIFLGVAYVLYTRKVRLALIGAGVYILIFLAILSNDITRSRIVEVFDMGKTDSQWGNISLRLQEWDSSLRLFKQNIFFGIGPGDFRDELVKEYQSNGWTNMAQERFNSHNQFIEILGSLGIIGFIVLLSVFVLSIRRAVLDRDLLFVVFLISFIMFSLTESTLEVQKGIVFFTLFNSVFYFSKTTFRKKNSIKI